MTHTPNQNPRFHIAVDLDGTLARGSINGHGWTESPDLSFIGEPIFGARETLTELKARGALISIFTGRLDPKWGRRQVARQRRLIRRWLQIYEIPYDHLTAIKPRFAFAIIDDRAIRFDESWADARSQVLDRWKEFRQLCRGHAK